MQLALKRTLPANAPISHKLADRLIKVRLCSQYGHGGLVINGEVYHATAQKGLHKLSVNEWEPSKWELFDIHSIDKEQVLQRFSECVGAPYDWHGIGNFALPVFGHSRTAFYCFSWCEFALTGERQKGLVTPESLLSIAAKKLGSI